MKCEAANMIFTFMLGMLIVLGAIFALQTVNHTREMRSLQAQFQVAQKNLGWVNLLLNDSVQYGKTHPDIMPILKPFEIKPAATRQQP